MISVLIVDDDKDTRDVLRLVLEDAGYAVTETEDGVQALEAVRASVVPLVVVLDLDLPRLDGTGVLQVIAQDKRLAARNAFILLTAVGSHRYHAAEAICVTLGVPLILKPFDLDALLDAVGAAADRLPS
ncbi:MAG TPA: response regulator [Ktedonobacterales bacterium]|nr:response regulator [Ktedonobacterales bacterium]